MGWSDRYCMLLSDREQCNAARKAAPL
jgi:hypothetical protein